MRIGQGCDCTLLSGGVDTSFIAYSLGEPSRLKAITVDLGGNDVRYAEAVASRLGMSYVIVKPGIGGFKAALREAVRILGTLDPVEAAAGVVHVISMQAAKRAGCRCILSGDGGDELFLGYTFLHSLSDDDMKRWIRGMVEKAWMPTAYIAGFYGLKALMPLYSWAAKTIALEAPLDCMVGRYRGRIYGKLLLRLYLVEVGAPEDVAWRPKAPVTSGAGSLPMLEKLAEGHGARGTAGLLGLKQATPMHDLLAVLLLDEGLRPPPQCHWCGTPCTNCGRCTSGNGYCRFCGAYKGKLHAG